MRTVSPSRPNWIRLLLTVGGPTVDNKRIFLFINTVVMTMWKRLQCHLSRKREHPPTLQQNRAHVLCTYICRPYRDSSKTYKPDRYLEHASSPHKSSWFQAPGYHSRHSEESHYCQYPPPHCRVGFGFQDCLQIVQTKRKENNIKIVIWNFVSPLFRWQTVNQDKYRRITEELSS